jgi:hypothetical protein
VKKENHFAGVVCEGVVLVFGGVAKFAVGGGKDFQGWVGLLRRDFVCDGY